MNDSYLMTNGTPKGLVGRVPQEQITLWRPILHSIAGKSANTQEKVRQIRETMIGDDEGIERHAKLDRKLTDAATSFAKNYVRGEQSPEVLACIHYAHLLCEAANERLVPRPITPLHTVQHYQW